MSNSKIKPELSDSSELSSLKPARNSPNSETAFQFNPLHWLPHLTRMLLVMLELFKPETKSLSLNSEPPNLPMRTPSEILGPKSRDTNLRSEASKPDSKMPNQQLEDHPPLSDHQLVNPLNSLKTPPEDQTLPAAMDSSLLLAPLVESLDLLT